MYDLELNIDGLGFGSRGPTQGRGGGFDQGGVGVFDPPEQSSGVLYGMYMHCKGYASLVEIWLEINKEKGSKGNART